MIIDNQGMVGIGTETPTERLSVNGTVRSKEVKVESINWPDYVFEPAERLKPLPEVKTYIDKNQHLPDMLSAAEIEKDGLNLGEMNKLLSQKVEETTLYLIEKDRQLEEQKIQLTTQSKQLEQLAQNSRRLLK